MRLLALAFSSVMPGPRSTRGFEDAYKCFVALVEKAGLRPTHFAFGNMERDASGKLKKWNSAAHKQGLQAGFDSVDMVSVISTPPDADFLDDEAMLNFTYTFPRLSDGLEEADIEANLVMVVEEPVWISLQQAHPGVLAKLASLLHWDFGYGHIAQRAEDPAAHIIGYDNGRQGKEESRRLEAWYDASKEDRLGRLRDVFAYNFLNPRQLAFALPGGRTLREFITEQPASNFTPVAPDLELWEVAPEATQRLREELLGTGVLIM